MKFKRVFSLLHKRNGKILYTWAFLSKIIITLKTLGIIPLNCQVSKKKKKGV